MYLLNTSFSCPPHMLLEGRHLALLTTLPPHPVTGPGTKQVLRKEFTDG